MGQKYIGDVGDGFNRKNIRASPNCENFFFFSSFLLLKNQEHICTKVPLITRRKPERELSNPDYRKVVFDYYRGSPLQGGNTVFPQYTISTTKMIFFFHLKPCQKEKWSFKPQNILGLMSINQSTCTPKHNHRGSPCMCFLLQI